MAAENQTYECGGRLAMVRSGHRGGLWGCWCRGQRGLGDGVRSCEERAWLGTNQDAGILRMVSGCTLASHDDCGFCLFVKFWMYFRCTKIVLYRSRGSFEFTHDLW